MTHHALYRVATHRLGNAAVVYIKDNCQKRYSDNDNGYRCNYTMYSLLKIVD